MRGLSRAGTEPSSSPLSLSFRSELRSALSSCLAPALFIIAAQSFSLAARTLCLLRVRSFYYPEDCACVSLKSFECRLGCFVSRFTHTHTHTPALTRARPRNYSVPKANREGDLFEEAARSRHNCPIESVVPGERPLMLTRWSSELLVGVFNRAMLCGSVE